MLHRRSNPTSVRFLPQHHLASVVAQLCKPRPGSFKKVELQPQMRLFQFAKNVKGAQQSRGEKEGLPERRKCFVS